MDPGAPPQPAGRARTAAVAAAVLLLGVAAWAPGHAWAQRASTGTLALPPEAAGPIRELIRDVGFDVPLPGGYRFDTIDIAMDTVTYSLRRTADGEEGEPVGRLVLTPRTEGAPPPPRSASFDLWTEPASTDPAVASHLEAAARSVLAHDVGGLYVGVSPAGGRPTGTGRAGRAIARALDGGAERAPALSTQIRGPALLLALLAVACALLRWRRRRPFGFDRRFAPTHLLPVFIQASVYAYWSLYWEGVEQHAPSLAAQLAYAFLFDPLWSLATRNRWTATFAPLPVVLSANLFVWFLGADQWLAYLVITVALASKSLVRADGRHVFNPSAIGLAAAGSLCLCAPEWFGYEDIAQQLALPPSMTEVVLCAVLVAQLRVPIVLVSIGAALTLGGLQSFTGWQLLSPYYPPVLIIILALATDPATIPRTGSGRLLYGLFVGASIHLCGIALTIATGMDYWAKVMPIPIANALVPWFDRWGAALPTGVEDALSPSRNRWHMLGWAAVVAYGLYVADVKPGFFEPSAHAAYHTRHVRSDPGGGFSCANNPAFCRPFHWADELQLWLGAPTPSPPPSAASPSR